MIKDKWLWCPTCGVHEYHRFLKSHWFCNDCNFQNYHYEGSKGVTYEEFIEYVREIYPRTGSNEFWNARYEVVKNMSRAKIISEIPFMAVFAVSDDYMRKES